MTETVRLRSGMLHLTIESAEMPLRELCGFASRRSTKRGFVFVSRVLGKHYPVRPRVMAETHARLAARLMELPGPIVLIALAETATGLGQGVFEELLRRTGRDDVLFLHTTRYRLRRTLALEFEERHSHAPDHLLYEPIDARLFRSAATLVLVDDEISTGRTLMNLAAAYRRLNPGVSSVHFVCLTDWLGPVQVPATVHSLLRGGFTFEPDPAFDPGEAPNVIGRGDFKDETLIENHGRLGLRGPRQYDLAAMIGGLASHGACPRGSLLVLGSGEFAHPPFLLARRLEERGWDVRYQSTTRSPLMVDGDISSVLEFTDNYGDAMPNYVYNVADRRYDRVLIGYETRPLPPEHTLPAMLGASVVYF